MTPKEFDQFKQAGFNKIPLYREVLADTETPLSSYLKLARGSYSYLFESVQGGEKWGRYSIIGLPASERFEAWGNQIKVFRDGECIDSYEHEDPLSAIEQLKSSIKVPNIGGLPSFSGGLVGYFSYDTVRYVEPKLANSVPQDNQNTPDILLLVSQEVLVFDNLKGKLHIIVHADPNEENSYEAAKSKLDKLEARLSMPIPQLPIMQMAQFVGEQKGLSCEKEFVSSFGRENFMSAVERVKDYILAGDAMQVVLSQKMQLPFESEPLNLYRALRCLNPSPYMYFLDMGDHQVVGSSPEILARLEDDEVTVRPIAGTRRRGYDDDEDIALEKELLNDPKEIAEHLMLIDLGRNDVGRVAKVGSVCLTEKMIVERYSHVMHIISNVIGKLDDNLSTMDVLRAALPAGTLSGAPKIRAMEIIDELEPEKRGIYGGAIGYMAWNGNMDTAIAIRTAVIKDGKIFVQAGAGVVADSVPELEWKETMNKARALFSAIDWAK